MSARTDELVEHINTLLQKYEVDNKILAWELAILVVKREKTMLKKGHRIAEQVIASSFRR